MRTPRLVNLHAKVQQHDHCYVMLIGHPMSEKTMSYVVRRKEVERHVHQSFRSRH